jgi:hypothetical protein
MSHQKNLEQEISDTQPDMEQPEHGEQLLEQTESIGTTEPLGRPCEVSLIDPKEVESIWPIVYPLIDKCHRYSNGELETQDFLGMITSGAMQLWVATDENLIFAAMITELVKYPRKKVMRIIAIGGEGMKRWMRFFPALEAAALQAGCTGLETLGRKGWLKVLKDWECTYYILTKDIKYRLQ